MDWLPGFKDWLLSNLDLLANLGSLAGFISALIFFFRARALRKHYLLLTRGVELLDELSRRSSKLNELLNAFVFLNPTYERQIKHELNQCRSTIKGLKSKVPLRYRQDLRRVHLAIKQAQRDFTEEKASDIYSELRRIADDINNHIEDAKIRA